MPACARPWHIGTLYNRDRRLAKLLLALLHAEGDLVVGDNQPYAASDATDYCIPVHAEPRGLIHCGIEIRQDLIADEAGQRAWAERLTRIFRAVEVRGAAGGDDRGALRPHSVIASEAKQSSAREARQTNARHQRRARHHFVSALAGVRWIASSLRSLAMTPSLPTAAATRNTPAPAGLRRWPR